MCRSLGLDARRLGNTVIDGCVYVLMVTLSGFVVRVGLNVGLSSWLSLRLEQYNILLLRLFELVVEYRSFTISLYAFLALEIKYCIEVIAI